MIDKLGRNDPCYCGSGKKYKNCCLLKKQQETGSSRGLGKRKFTAKVLSSGANKTQEAQAVEQGQSKAAIDYSTLMERSFGEALHTHEDKPPIPVNPDEYLKKEEEKEKHPKQ
jgi:uncharacterized protein